MNRLQREHAGLAHQLHCQAGLHYEERGELETALAHYLAAQEYESAARLLSVFAGDYVERGRVDVLHRYLSALPVDVMKDNPQLLLQHGNAHWRLGQAGAAMTAYEEARVSFAARRDPNGLCRVLTRLAEVNRAQGNYRQAEQLSRGKPCPFQALAMQPGQKR